MIESEALDQGLGLDHRAKGAGSMGEHHSARTMAGLQEYRRRNRAKADEQDRCEHGTPLRARCGVCTEELYQRVREHVHVTPSLTGPSRSIEDDHATWLLGRRKCLVCGEISPEPEQRERTVTEEADADLAERLKFAGGTRGGYGGPWTAKPEPIEHTPTTCPDLPCEHSR